MIRVEAVKTKNKNPCLGREVSSLGETEFGGAWQQKYHQQYSVKIIKKRRSLTMKKFVKSMMLTVVSLMAVAFFSACDKDMVDEPLQVQETKAVINDRENLSLFAASKPIDQYSEEEIVKEVFPMLQKFIDAQFAYAMGNDKIPQWDQYLIVPDQKLKEDMDLAINKKLIPTILSATGALKKSDLGYTKVFFSEGKWVISKAVEYFKIHLKRDNSEPIVSEGGWNYSFEVAKDKSGTWKINSWRDDENLMRYPFWNPKPSTTLFLQKKEGLIQPMTVGLESRAYNRVAAANYAINHWNSPNSLWCDYTTTGGDCTNFVSQCLLAGGWTQKTGSGYCQNDAWFHKGAGYCWNSSTVKNYSCSWTQAKDLYRYLNFVPNANVIWLGNTCVVPRIGDILQFKGNNGEIVHSAIVVATNGSYAYIAYRNAAGFEPVGSLEVNMLDEYDFLYYWRINGSN